MQFLLVSFNLLMKSLLTSIYFNSTAADFDCDSTQCLNVVSNYNYYNYSICLFVCF